jgi:hypothetical protein
MESSRNRGPEIFYVGVRDLVVVVNEGHIPALRFLEQLFALATDALLATIKIDTILNTEMRGQPSDLLADPSEKTLQRLLPPRDRRD